MAQGSTNSAIRFVSSDVVFSAQLLFQVINLLKVDCLPHMEQDHFQQLKVVRPEIRLIGISVQPNQIIHLLTFVDHADQRRLSCETGYALKKFGNIVSRLTWLLF